MRKVLEGGQRSLGGSIRSKEPAPDERGQKVTAVIEIVRIDVHPVETLHEWQSISNAENAVRPFRLRLLRQSSVPVERRVASIVLGFRAVAGLADVDGCLSRVGHRAQQFLHTLQINWSEHGPVLHFETDEIGPDAI